MGAPTIWPLAWTARGIGASCIGTDELIIIPLIRASRRLSEILALEIVSDLKVLQLQELKLGRQLGELNMLFNDVAPCGPWPYALDSLLPCRFWLDCSWSNLAERKGKATTPQ